MRGICDISNTRKEIEATGDERTSFLGLLNGNASKTVKLGSVLGIGGEGIVIRDIRYKLVRTFGREVAIKFVKFDKQDGEELGTEKGYEERLKKLGDYKVATGTFYGGYTRPYLDFGISEIFGSSYYVIGEQDDLQI